MIIRVTDISGWEKIQWSSPLKGSRPNYLYINPLGELHYFKQSKERLPCEFWSEILASKIGAIAGFNVLDYNIGVDGELLGCLSKSMIVKEEGQALYHGVDALKDYINEFVLTKKPICDFSFIEALCAEEQFHGLLDNFIEMMVFDALIGNTDRHTENWAFISSIVISFKSNKGLFRRLFRRDGLDPRNINIETSTVFSPIYDSGCCFGREFSEEAVVTYIEDKDSLIKYINRGKSEILFDNQPVSLFEMVRKLKVKYPEQVNKILSRLRDKLSVDNITSIVMSADSELSTLTHETYLSLNRKKLIIVILVERLNVLKNIK